MTDDDRLSLKIQRPTGDRFERFQRADESQTGAVARLLDAAGIPEVLRCSKCGDTVQAHARDEQGLVLCFGCAGIDEDQVQESPLLGVEGENDD